jgi:hypothetical protein
MNYNEDSMEVETGDDDYKFDLMNDDELISLITELEIDIEIIDDHYSEAIRETFSIEGMADRFNDIRFEKINEKKDLIEAIKKELQDRQDMRNNSISKRSRSGNDDYDYYSKRKRGGYKGGNRIETINNRIRTLLEALINDEVRETMNNYNSNIETNVIGDRIVVQLGRERETYNNLENETRDIRRRLDEGVLRDMYSTQLEEIYKIKTLIELLLLKIALKEHEIKVETVGKRSYEGDGSDGPSKRRYVNGGKRKGKTKRKVLKKKKTKRKQLKNRKTKRNKK